jgi:hypothetical protein
MTRMRRADGVSSVRIDGEAVLLHETRLTRLDSTAAAVWDALAVPGSVGDVVHRLSEQVVAERMAEDVGSVVRELLELGLLVDDVPGLGALAAPLLAVPSWVGWEDSGSAVVLLRLDDGTSVRLEDSARELWLAVAVEPELARVADAAAARHGAPVDRVLADAMAWAEDLLRRGFLRVAADTSA